MGVRALCCRDTYCLRVRWSCPPRPHRRPAAAPPKEGVTCRSGLCMDQKLQVDQQRLHPVLCAMDSSGVITRPAGSAAQVCLFPVCPTRMYISTFRDPFSTQGPNFPQENLRRLNSMSFAMQRPAQRHLCLILAIAALQLREVQAQFRLLWKFSDSQIVADVES